MDLYLKEALADFYYFYGKKSKIWGIGPSYHYGFNTHSDLINRLTYTAQKIIPLIEKYPKLFQDKSLLDFGCGTGEHSYILSHFCSSVDCYDPQPIHNNLLNNLFLNNNKIKVISEEECYFSSYDTILLSGVLECVPDYINWFNTLCSNIDFKNLILIFAPDKERLVENHPRHFRLYDDLEKQTTTNEKDLLEGVENLYLLDRFSYDTTGNLVEDHKKVVHIYQKK